MAEEAVPASDSHTERERTLPPISEMIAEIMRQVPASDRTQLPPDWSENHDHYLYGAPRKK